MTRSSNTALRNRRRQLLARTALGGLAGALAIGATPALAQLTGVGEVVSTGSNGGAVGVASGGGVTNVTTGAGRSIVNWSTLNVTTSEQLNFYFNNRSDIVLNRVLNGSASIDGVLNGCLATCGTTGGNIWILSAGGVVIGANAQVNTGGFLASTGGLTDADFLDGDMNFAFSGAPDGSAVSVLNGAQISANGGALALIAPVLNTAAGSTITGTNGSDVTYASAQTYNVTFAPSGVDDLDLISFEVASRSDGAGGTPGLTLNGTINANQVYAAIVSKSGVAASILLGGNITATTASGENGDIVLTAGSGFSEGISLNPAGGFEGSIVQDAGSVLTAANVTMRTADSISVDAINATGQVWLDSAWAGISQTGAITASTLRAEAAAGIDLSNAGNDFDTISALDNNGAGVVSLTDLDGFHITGGIDNWTTAGTVNLTALNGSIAQSGMGRIWAGTLNASATSDIALGTLTNHLTTLGTLTAGGAISYRGGTNFDLNGAVTAASLTLRSDTGAITQSGAPLNVGQLSVQAETGINLNRVSNQIDEITDLSTTSGDIILISNGDLSLAGNVTGAATVSLHIFSGGITQNSGVITAANFSATADAGLAFGGQNQVGQLAGLVAGGSGDISFRNAADLVLNGNITAAGDDVALYSTSGAISQNAANAITAERLTMAAADNIDVSTATNDITTLAGLASTGGYVFYRNADSFDIQGDITTSTASGAVLRTVGAGAGVTQTSGTIDVGWFGANTSGSIIIEGATNQIRRLVATSSSASVSIRTTTDLAMGQPLTAGQTLSLTSDGRIYQEGSGFLAANTLNLSAVTGLSLSNTGNGVQNLRTITNTTSGGVVIRNYSGSNTALTGNITATGQSVSITDVAGGLIQNGGVITAGTLSLSATGGINATRNNSINSLGAIAAGGGFSFVNAGSLLLTGDIASAGSAVSLTTNSGQIEQTGGIITAGVLNLSAGGRIWVNNANAVASLGTVTAGGHVLFRNDGNTVVGGDITANGFDVTLRSNNGSIAQTAGSDITSRYLQVIAQTGINLTNAGNDVGELAWLQNGSGGAAFGQTNGFTVAGAIQASGQTLSLTSLAGAITQTSGTISAGTLSASAAGNLTFDQTNNGIANLGVISSGGVFTFRNGSGFDLTGNINATTGVSLTALNGGAINQAGGIITTASLTADAGGELSLGGLNQVTSIGGLTAGGNLLYRQIGDLAVPAITAAGTVSLYSTTGDITQTGAITADTLVLGAGDDIVLGQNFIAKLGQVDAGGDLTAMSPFGLSSGALELTDDITVGGAMMLAHTDDITQTGGAITAGSLTLNTMGALVAAGANSVSGNTWLNATDATFNAVGDLTIQVNVNGAASITSGGAVVIDGVGASTGDRLNIQAVNGISQGAAGLNFVNFGNLTNTTSGGISLTNGSWVNLTGAINAVGQGVTLNVLNGGIIQNSGSIINARRLSVTTTQGAIIGEVNQVAELGVINVGAHNFSFRTFGDLLIDGDLTSALNVQLTSATGSVTQTAGSDITVGGGLNVWAETGINLTNAGNNATRIHGLFNLGSGGIAYSQTNGILIDGTIRAWNQTVSLTSLAGAIAATNNIFFPQIEAGTLNLSAAGAITLHRDNDVDNLGVVTAGGDFTFNDVDGFNLSGNIGAGATVLTARNGSISQTGGVIAATSLNANATGNLDLDRANLVGGNVTLTAGGDAVYRNDGSLRVGGASAGGSISLRSNTGAITQVGAITGGTLNVSAVTGITLIDAGNDINALGTVSNTTNGQISFTNNGGFDLTGAITAGGSQFVSLTSMSGGITQQAGGTITAQVLTLSAMFGGATLGGDNDVDQLGVIIGGPSFVFNDIDDFDITSVLNAQTADLTAGSAITQSSGNLNVGTLSLKATSVTLDGANNVSVLADVDVSGDMSFRDVGGFDLSGAIAVDGTLSLAGTDAIIQTGGSITANTLNATANGLFAYLSFTSGMNTIANLGDLSTTGSLSYYGVGDFSLTGLISAPEIAIVSVGGAIRQSGGSIVSPWARIFAADGLDLTSATNDIDTVQFLVSAAGDINYVDADGFDVTGATTPSGHISLTAGGTGSIAQSISNIVAATLTMSAGGDIVANSANDVDTVNLNGANVSFTNGGSFAANVVTATGAASLTSTNGKITQTAGTGKVVADSLTASAATGLEFFGGQNDIRVLAELSSAAGGVTYRDMGGFDIGGDITAAGQQVELVSDATGADGNDIIQSAGVITANRITGTSAGDFLLIHANVVGRIDALNAGGALAYRGAGSVALWGDLTAGTALNLASDTASIVQNGGVITAQTLGGSAAAGAVLGGDNAVDALGGFTVTDGDFLYNGAGDVLITGVIGVASDQRITLTTDAGLIGTGGGGRLVGGGLVASASGDIGLQGDVDRIEGLASTGGDIAWADDDGFGLAGDITGRHVVLNATGDIVQSAGVIRADDTFRVNNSLGDTTLNGANRIQRLGYIHAVGSFSLVNAASLDVANVVDVGGDLTLRTTAGDIFQSAAATFIGDDVTITAADLLDLKQASARNDMTLTGGAVRASALTLTGAGLDLEGDDYNLTITSTVGGVLLGATSAGAITTGNRLERFAGLGAVMIDSAGDIAINLDSASAAIGFTAAGTSSVFLANGDLDLADISATNFLLTVQNGALDADSVAIDGGDYVVRAEDFIGAALNLTGTARDISITDTVGNLTLAANLTAQRNLTIGAAVQVLQTGSVGLVAGADAVARGDLSITALGITVDTIGADGNVSLDAGNGIVDIATLIVGQDYNLTGGWFSNGALTPLGLAAGTWTLSAAGPVDFTGLTLTYNGDVRIDAGGDLTGDVVQSILGSVTIDGASLVDVGGVYAGEGIVATTTDRLILGSATASAGDVDLTGAEVAVIGLAEASGDVRVTASNGGADVAAAKAGENITVAATNGHARLGAANLAGASGDLTLSADNGWARLGAVDDLSISTDNVFERAVGGDGTVSITGAAGAAAYLYASAAIDFMQGGSIDVVVESGDLALGSLDATTDDVYADALGGSLTVKNASASNGELGLYAAGDLTATGDIHGLLGIQIQAGGLLDGSLASSIDTDGDLLMTGGEVVLGAVSGGTSITVGASTGDAYVEAAISGGTVQVLSLAGDATLRAAEGPDGVAVVAEGKATFGADTAAEITNAHYGIAGIGGCGCGAAGFTVLSYNGDVAVNLDNVSGVFDLIRSDFGDINAVLKTGNLTISDLIGVNIDVNVQSGTLETGHGDPDLFGAAVNGGDYSVRAQDFLGNALSVTGTLVNYTVVDTMGGLDMTGVSIVAAGDVLVDAGRYGALTGDAQLTAGGDVNVNASSIALDRVSAGRDLDLYAWSGNVDVATSVTTAGNYTLTGHDFSTAALSPLGARAGTLSITDTAGGLDYSGATLAYGGSITIGVGGGLFVGGDVTSTNGDILVQAESIDAGTLSAETGKVDAYSSSGSSGVKVAAARAKDWIYIYSGGGDAVLGSATLLGTDANTLMVQAAVTGNAVLGATLASGITAGNTFTSAGSSTTADVSSASGDSYVHLDRSDAISSVFANTNVGVAVRNGSFLLGSAYAFAGDVDIQGPGGLTVHSFFSNQDATIGGADVTLHNGTVSGDLTVDVTGDLDLVGPGAYPFAKLEAGGDISLGAGGRISQASDSALVATGLDVDAGQGVSLIGYNRVASIRGATTDAGGFTYNSVRDGGVEIAGAIDALGQTVDLRVAGGPLTQSGAGVITADTLTGASDGGVDLSAANQVGRLGVFSVDNGGFSLNVDRMLTVGGAVDADGPVAIQSHAMTIGANGSVRSTATGDALVLAANGLFQNQSGADAVLTENGRWLIYTQAHDNPNGSTATDNYGGLDGRSYYGVGYDFGGGGLGASVGAGNRFVHAYRPVITFTPISTTVTYSGAIPGVGATVDGILGHDIGANPYSGSPLLSGNTSRNVGAYLITAALGSLISDMNYDFAFSTGMLVIDPKVLSGLINAQDKIYDGTSAASGAITLTGVIAGDEVSAAAVSYSFNDRNAGTDKTVTASGASLSGEDAGNYVLSPLATALADVLRRNITATVTANDKTYDGTTAATGLLALNGVLAGDDLSITGELLFGDRNASLGKTVSVVNAQLSGTDLGNYDVTIGTDVADIARKVLSATFTANDKTYDGTGAASASLTVTGILAGDDASVNGSYAFADKNAGTNKTVTADLAIHGDDAGNYELAPVATALADIFRKTVTVAITLNNKTYDGTTTGVGSLTASGILAGDDASVARGTYTFADAEAGAGKTVTIAGVTLTGSGSGNYELAGVPTTLLADILRRRISIKAEDKSKLFSQVDPALTYQITAGSLVAGHSFTGGLSRAPGDAFGDYAIGQGTLALSANYEILFTPGVLRIRPVPGGGQDGGDAFKYLSDSEGFSLNWNPTRNFDYDRTPICLSASGCAPGE